MANWILDAEKYKHIELIERVLGKGTKFQTFDDLKGLCKVMAHLEHFPALMYLVFTKGFREKLCRLWTQGWPFKIDEDSFMKKYDFIVFAYNISGQVLIFHSSLKGLPR